MALKREFSNLLKLWVLSTLLFAMTAGQSSLIVTSFEQQNHPLLENKIGKLFNVSTNAISDNERYQFVARNAFPMFSLDFVSGSVILLPNQAMSYRATPVIDMDINVILVNQSDIILRRIHVTIQLIPVTYGDLMIQTKWLMPTTFTKAVLYSQTTTPPYTKVYQISVTQDKNERNIFRFGFTPGLEGEAQGRFIVNPLTGVIYTNGSANFPSNTVYNLSVRVVQGSDFISGYPFKDMPVFVFTSYQPVQLAQPVAFVNFSENTSPSVSIGMVPAQPLNNILDPLVYSPSPSSSSFYLVSSTGLFYSTVSFDFESLILRQWEMVVTVSENATGQWSVTNFVRFNLLDVNDNPPYFPAVIINGSKIFDTGTPVNTVVANITALDKDTFPENRRNTYTLAGSWRSKFTVSTDSVSGNAIIQNLNPLNYQELLPNKPFYELGLTADDGYGTASTTVRIYVRNANANPPQFVTDNFVVNVTRDSIGRVFFYLKAFDVDGSGISYYFYEGKTSTSNFLLNTNTGAVSMTAIQPLNVYYLQVQAWDDGKCSACDVTSVPLKSSIVNFTVNIIEPTNKYKPQFTPCPASLSVEENLPPGSNVSIITATDADNYTTLTYSLIPNGVVPNPEEYVAINSNTGQITTSKVLDREETGLNLDVFYFTVKVTDSGLPSQSSLCVFLLNIIDKPDNNPRFDPDNYLRVLQTGVTYTNETLTQVFAWDLDDRTTDNGKVFYTLLSNNISGTVSVDPNLGFVNYSGSSSTNSGPFIILVKAYNLVAPSSNFSTVNVIVYFRSDSSLLPLSIAAPRYYNVSDFPENSTVDSDQVPGVVITPPSGNVCVWELVVGRFPQTNRYAQGSRYFNMNDTTGCAIMRLRLSAKINMYDVQQVYVRLRSTTIVPSFGRIYTDFLVQINILDTNNEKPIFISPEQYKYIYMPESTQSGQKVQQLFAYDRDVTPNSFRNISYFISVNNTDSKYFNVSDDGFIIASSNQFDFESNQTSFLLYVQAKDRNASSIPSVYPSPNLSDQQIIVIQLTDVNDNRPIFLNVLNVFNISITSIVGTWIANVTATDKDADTTLYYSLFDYSQPMSVSSNFYISPYNGSIFVGQRLDLTNRTTFQLIVMADDGLWSSSTNVTINVIGRIVMPPYFDSTNLNMNVTEGLVGGIQIGTVTAYDPSSSNGLSLTYSIQPADGVFTIHPTGGNITVTKTLKRDPPDGVPQYHLTVCADSNNPIENQRGCATVIVKVNDINNNGPVWPVSQLHQSVGRNSPTSTPIGKLQALDVDSDASNTMINYNLIDPPAYVNIDQFTGAITVKGTLPSDDKFTFVVGAYNPPSSNSVGTAANTATATVTVTLLDIGPSAPIFPGTKNYVSEVSDDILVNSSFTTVRATSSSLLTYKLVTTSLPNYFDLVYLPYVNAAGIRLVKALNAGTDPQTITLTVSATDPSTNVMDTCTITIKLVSSNKNTPKITLSQYSVSLVENQMSTLCQITVTDADTADTSFDISIDPATNINNIFGLSSIQSTSASLGIVGTLDREAFTRDTNLRSPVWNILILASDRRSPYRTGTATYTLTIVDRNDNAPQLSDQYQQATVPENAPKDTAISPEQIYAYDLDYNSTNGPPFSFSSDISTAEGVGNWTGKFYLKSGNGFFTITTQTVFSYDTLNEPYSFYLPVVITDVGGLSGTSTVTVSVLNSVLRNSFKDIDIYISQAWSWFVGSANSSIGIGYVNSIETDRSAQTYVYTNPADSQYIFTMNRTGFVSMSGNFTTGTFYVNASVVSGATRVTATFRVYVVYVSNDAIQNAMTVRIPGLTAAKFIHRRRRPGSTEPSDITPSYSDLFRGKLAPLLGTSDSNVDALAVQDSPKKDYVDAYFAVHGSPYYYTPKLQYLFSTNLAAFNDIIAPTGAKITVFPVDVCPSGELSYCPGGCRGQVKENPYPTPVFRRSTSFVGVDYKVVSSCDCITATNEAPKNCSSSMCLNNGTCSIQNGTVTPICSCLSGYEGPMCQQLQIAFSFSGFALYPSFGSCSSLRISFHVLSNNAGPMLFLYVGPMSVTTPADNMKDYLAIQLDSNGRLQVFIELGSGSINQTLSSGPPLNDNQWHRIDFILNNGNVSVYVDEGRGLTTQSNGQNLFSMSSKFMMNFQCPGNAMKLNVGQVLLQLGGRVEQQSNNNYYPSTLTKNGLIGAIRNLRVNGYLYDLSVGTRGQGVNAEMWPSTLLSSCRKSDGTSKCGNGVCWAFWNGAMDSGVCDCQTGWYKDASGRCTIQDQPRELKNQSFIQITRKAGRNIPDPRWIQLDAMFRTRQTSGTILNINGVWPNVYRAEKYELRLVDSQVVLIIDFGDFTDLTFQLPNTNVSDGAWHNIRVRRSLSAIEMLLDGGGDTYNYYYKPVDTAQLFNYITYGDQMSIGALLSQNTSISNYTISPPDSDLIQTCVMDFRVDNGWYSLDSNAQSNDLSNGGIVQMQNVDSTCSALTPCPTGMSCPINLICVPAWKPLYIPVCGCGFNQVFFAGWCYSINPCLPNPCLNGGVCSIISTGRNCTCPSPYTGTNCEVVNPYTASAYFLLLLLLLLLLIILLLLCIWWNCCRSAPPPAAARAPDEFKRENLMPYFVGAGEVDTSHYDLTALGLGTPPGPVNPQKSSSKSPHPDLDDFLNARLQAADEDLKGPPQDYPLDYGYEGQGSDVGDDISSLFSGSSDASQNYDALQNWGSPFIPLAELYAQPRPKE